MVALKVVERHRVGVDRFYGLDFSLVYDPTTGCLSRRDGLPMLPGQPWASLSSNDELLSNVQRDHKVSSLERLKSSMYIVRIFCVANANANTLYVHQSIIY